MSVLVDTGVFFAHHDTDADNHDQATATFDRLLDGESGNRIRVTMCLTRQ
jgi:hypothetical protein